MTDLVIWTHSREEKNLVLQPNKYGNKSGITYASLINSKHITNT